MHIHRYLAKYAKELQHKAHVYNHMQLHGIHVTIYFGEKTCTVEWVWGKDLLPLGCSYLHKQGNCAS